MLVKNTSPRLITVGATHLPKVLPADLVRLSPAEREHYEERVMLAHARVVIAPGANEVDTADWLKLTDAKTGNALILAMVEDGTLVAKKGVDSIADIKDIGEALRVVAATGDVAMLDRWLTGGEKRKRVLDAMSKQRLVIEGLLASAEAESAVTLK